MHCLSIMLLYVKLVRGTEVPKEYLSFPNFLTTFVISLSLPAGITEFKLMIGLNGIEHGGEDVTDELDIQVRVQPKFDLQGAFQKMCRKGSETLSFARAAEAIALLGYRISKHSVCAYVFDIFAFLCINIS